MAPGGVPSAGLSDTYGVVPYGSRIEMKDEEVVDERDSSAYSRVDFGSGSEAPGDEEEIR
jgi:hypothetical protein